MCVAVQRVVEALTEFKYEVCIRLQGKNSRATVVLVFPFLFNQSVFGNYTGLVCAL